MTTDTIDRPTTSSSGGHLPAHSSHRWTSTRWRPRWVGEWLVLAACAALLLWFSLPLYVVVATALKGSAAGTSSFLAPPSGIDLQGFRTAWDSLAGNLWNSVQITVPATIASCAIGALNGFILAKTPYRGSQLLFTLMLLGMFIPFQSIIIPLFQFLRAMNLTGTLTGV